jgi:hypothetical protein
MSMARWGVIIVCAAIGGSCSASVEGEKGTRVSYTLAHNTERDLIASETAMILQLYDFTIELNDPTRQHGSLQTQWRQIVQPVMVADRPMIARDRALLHLSRRGRSSVVYNVYFMVNAAIEFEFQSKEEGTNTWSPAKPPPEMLEQYAAIVKDIRNRMLKYQSEF